MHLYLQKLLMMHNLNFSRFLEALKKDNERWKKMVQRVDGGLGELLGQLYVKKYFNEAAKKGWMSW